MPMQSDRQLFYYLLNADEYPAAVPMARQRLDDALGSAIGDPVDIVFDKGKVTLSEAVSKTPPPMEFSQAQQHELCRQYAPAALIEGCWLQNVANAATSHTAVSAYLFRLYAECINRHRNYRQYLCLQGIRLPDLNSHAFAEQAQFADWAFSGPVVALSLAQFPLTMLPEILGFTLAHVSGPRPSEPAAIDQNTLRLPTIAAINCYVEAIDPRGWEPVWRRLCSGYALFRTIEQNFFMGLHQQKPSSARTKMITLLKQKARYAKGNHRGKTLGGKKLDEWFATEPFPAEAFLTALEQSPYVNRHTPKHSRLLTQLTSFGGPMFGIFSEQELNDIRAWLTNPGDLKTLPHRLTQPHQTVKTTNEAIEFTGREKQRITNTFDNRHSYHRLLNVESHPEALASALHITDTIIKKSERWRHKRHPVYGKFFDYHHDVFNKKIEAIYQREMQAYKPFSPPAKIGKDAYRWAILQLAPTLLVDGCWLQNIAQSGTSHLQTNAQLFQIYADEIGNGQTQANHPNVYRALLQSMGLTLPDFAAPEFAALPRFLDASFDIPVYLLAISQYPKARLPEILGLNLAIELSGLGKTYMHLVDELNYWNIDPQIIQLHITIDNLASGHAAIARDAIHLYLDQVLETSGHAAMQHHWQRIWAGLWSLTIASARFKRAMTWHYCRRFLLRDQMRSCVTRY